MPKVECLYTAFSLICLYERCVNEKTNTVTDISNTVWHIDDILHVLETTHGYRKAY